jgi:hypothetical protein
MHDHVPFGRPYEVGADAHVLFRLLEKICWASLRRKTSQVASSTETENSGITIQPIADVRYG